MPLIQELGNAAQSLPTPGMHIRVMGLGPCHPLQADPGLGVALTSLVTASRSVTPRLKSRMSAPGRGSSTASMSVSSAEAAALSTPERRQAAGQSQGRAQPACTWSPPRFNHGQPQWVPTTPLPPTLVGSSYRETRLLFLLLLPGRRLAGKNTPSPSTPNLGNGSPHVGQTGHQRTENTDKAGER